MKITNIRINDLKSPIIDSTPRISWTTPENMRQSTYKVDIYDDLTKEKIWTTGQIESSEHNYISLDAPLEALTNYYTVISIQDEDNSIITSDAFHFVTGKLKDAWNAKWIAAHYSKEKGQKNPMASYLRKNFTLDKKVAKAYLAISGLGQFAAKINSQQVSDDWLPTPVTDYSKQVQYRVYDVSNLLQKGTNSIASILGNGFYNPTTRDPWQCTTTIWKDVPKLIAELHITYEDGSKKLVISDNTWKSSQGPIQFNGMRHGEHYDARLEQKDWEAPTFDDSKWGDCIYVRTPGGTLRVMEMEPIRAIETFKPVSIKKIPNGWQYDAGKSLSGVANIAIKGKKDSTVYIRYSDILFENGRIDQKELASFNQDQPFHTDIYTKASDDTEYWNPIFAYHGFRYIEIETEAEQDIDDVKIFALSNDLTRRSRFVCSDNVVNQMQQLTINTVHSMLFSLLASDTAREQTSWTGDTGLSIEQLYTNFYSAAFFRNWQQVFRDAQLKSGTVPCIIPSAGWGYTGLNGPDWSHPMYEVPTQLYKYYGDKKMISDNYDALVRYCSYLDSMAVDGIVNYGLGDWCAPFEGEAISVNMESFSCPVDVSDTAFYHSALKAAQRNAEILGKNEDAKDFKKRAEYVAQAFRTQFYDPKTNIVKGDCQTATAMMIHHEIATPQEIPLLLNTLKRQIADKGGALDFGILGMKAVLTSMGEHYLQAEALDLLVRPEYPSIRNWLDMGATTLWEAWNGRGSRNHHMFSSFSDFLYKYIAGIRPDNQARGYDKIVFAPPIDIYLENASAQVETQKGMASISWKKDNDNMNIQLSVPYGATAVLHIPKQYKGMDMKNNILGKAKDLPWTSNEHSYSTPLKAGEYTFDIDIKG